VSNFVVNKSEQVSQNVLYLNSRFWYYQ